MTVSMLVVGRGRSAGPTRGDRTSYEPAAKIFFSNMARNRRAIVPVTTRAVKKDADGCELILRPHTFGQPRRPRVISADAGFDGQTNQVGGPVDPELALDLRTGVGDRLVAEPESISDLAEASATG